MPTRTDPRTDPSTNATAAPQRRRSRRTGPNPPTSGPRCTHQVARGAGALVALVMASAAQAGPLTVSSYSMPDGNTGVSTMYGDNLYTGTNNAGMLSGGVGELTDGVFGTQVGTGPIGAWTPYVLWLSRSVQITFDLGAVQTVDSITGHFNAFGGAGVRIAPFVNIRFSADGTHFGANIRQDFVTGPYANDTPLALDLLSTSGSGRYVQLELPQISGWYALSEVQLANNLPVAGPNGVPEPASAALVLGALGALAATRRRRPR